MLKENADSTGHIQESFYKDLFVRKKHTHTNFYSLLTQSEITRCMANFTLTGFGSVQTFSCGQNVLTFLLKVFGNTIPFPWSTIYYV